MQQKVTLLNFSYFFLATINYAVSQSLSASFFKCEKNFLLFFLFFIFCEVFSAIFFHFFLFCKGFFLIFFYSARVFFSFFFILQGFFSHFFLFAMFCFAMFFLCWRCFVCVFPLESACKNQWKTTRFGYWIKKIVLNNWTYRSKIETTKKTKKTHLNGLFTNTFTALWGIHGPKFECKKSAVSLQWYFWKKLYCIISLCWVTFCIHSGIIPVGQFFPKCTKSINQA